GAECELCPKDWWAHWEKCDWDSKRSQIWTKNWKDCESRNSQMLEIQDQEEMMLALHVWISLNNTSHTRNWSWVDGSPLNQTL
ncbi:unnamed protein product, partial [Lepidochelys kempii]